MVVMPPRRQETRKVSRVDLTIMQAAIWILPLCRRTMLQPVVVYTDIILMREKYSLEPITETINHSAAVQGLDVVRLRPQSLLESQAEFTGPAVDKQREGQRDTTQQRTDGASDLSIHPLEFVRYSKSCEFWARSGQP